jgi:hypothetical protein
MRIKVGEIVADAAMKRLGSSAGDDRSFARGAPREAKGETQQK